MRGKKVKQLRRIEREMMQGAKPEKQARIRKGLKKAYRRRSPKLLDRLSEMTRKECGE